MKNTILISLALTASALGQGAGPLVPPGTPADGTYRTLGELWDKLETLEAQSANDETRTPLVIGAPDSPAVTTSGASHYFIINQPGSYYLAGNLTATTKLNAIRIDAPDVTLDLNGFLLTRSTSGGIGIDVTETAHRCTVSNGSITGFSRSLFASGTIPSTGGIIERVSCGGGSLHGIWGGVGWAIENCTADGFGFFGIASREGSRVSGCVATSNTQEGIKVSSGSEIVGCVSRGNGQAGIEVRATCLVRDCVVENNGGFGITSNPGSASIVVKNCQVNANTGGGIMASSALVASGCRVRGGSGGVDDGIVGGIGSMITDCAVTLGRDGIVVEYRSTVRNCQMGSIGGVGVKVVAPSLFGDCLIENNSCEGNGGSFGLQITGSGSRVIGNRVGRFSTGIKVGGDRNFIAQNHVTSGSPYYDIAAGNRVGPIVSAPSSPAISGSTGGAGVGTTDPWANFSY